MKKLSLTFLTAFWMLHGVFAQTPGMFQYQAVLRDANGAVIANQAKTIVIDILKGSATGGIVFSESHNVTSTAQGIINLVIGSINTTGLALIDWGSDRFFIRITVDALVVGTSQLFSVPYALRAKSAEYFNEQDPSFTSHFDFSNAANGDLIQYNGTKWVKLTPNYSSQDHTHLEATSEKSGFMSADDKVKLNGLQNADGSETIINAGNKISVLGLGTLAQPYIIGLDGITLTPVLSSAEIVLLSPEAGQTVYNSTESLFQIFNGSNWVSIPVTCWPQPTIANAGPNQNFVDASINATLSANTPELHHGTGQWSIVSGEGGSFNNNTNPSAVFTGQGCTTYQLRWTISTICGSRNNNVNITFNHTPTTANAGPDQSFTNATTSATLAASIPTQGTGLWTIISGEGGSFGDDTNPNTVFTGQGCTDYELKWTISTPCSSKSDNVNITFNQTPTVANAGSDQSFTNTTTSATLAANTPTQGTGFWTVLSGEGGSFGDDTNPNTLFTGQGCTDYVLKWTISTPCSSNSDNVNITFNQTPTVANAGFDQTFTNATTSATLTANTPTQGTGLWTIISGEGGSFGNDADPNTLFTGQVCTAYELKWTISTPCSSNSDNVNITFIHTPTTANAGSYQSFTNGTISTTLAANTPTEGSGKWTILSGVGGSFNNDTNPTATFTGQYNIFYELQWRISTTCSHSEDTVVIFFGYNAPGDQVSDIDGNTYNTIWIGTQLWMAENLKTTKYNNGSDISNQHYAWYDDNISNKTTYGALYNWYSVSAENLCPTGWHVPTEGNWTVLIDFMGGESVAGAKLKEVGTVHWNSPNSGTNDYGFTALPGGYKSMTGFFSNINVSGTWYSSSLESPSSNHPVAYRIYNYTSSIEKWGDYANVMFSVRCIKDAK